MAKECAVTKKSSKVAGRYSNRTRATEFNPTGKVRRKANLQKKHIFVHTNKGNIVMVQQVTNGIKISVQTKFIGTSYHNERLHYAFSYRISIENQSNDSVQLLNRHWKIFDSLNNIEIVDGPGVVEIDADEPVPAGTRQRVEDALVVERRTPRDRRVGDAGRGQVDGSLVREPARVS